VSANHVFINEGLVNKGGVAIILLAHISNVFSSNLGSFLADFTNHVLNPL
jgi:hypothetical protein